LTRLAQRADQASLRAWAALRREAAVAPLRHEVPGLRALVGAPARLLAEAAAVRLPLHAVRRHLPRLAFAAGRSASSHR